MFGESRLDARLLPRVTGATLRGLGPRALARSPTLLVLELAAVLATLLFALAVANGGKTSAAFAGQVAAWSWITLVLARLADTLADARARPPRRGPWPPELPAKRLVLPFDEAMTWLHETVPAGELQADDVVLVEAGDTIPADGEVIEGVAAVDEAAVTGESAPVIREAGGDRSGVVGGTRVLSDWLKVRVTAAAGHGWQDHVRELRDSARRHAGRRELVLTVPLLGLAIAVVLLAFLGSPTPRLDGVGPATFLTALVAALLPTTVAGLLSAAGLAGLGRLLEAGVVAKSARAVEAAGEVGTVLLDKTGTITAGGRTAEACVPLPGASERQLVEAAALASLGDDTPEGRSILRFAERRGVLLDPARVEAAMPFTAEARMSGARLRDGGEVRKGAVDAVLAWAGAAAPPALAGVVARIAGTGGTPLAVARDRRLLGVVHLKDTVRPDLRERFAQLRRMGVRSVMVTGDNPLTAAAIAAEAGVDDFVAQATPEAKLALIRAEQAKGRPVAMCGDATNDAPALAQADVGVAMAHGTAAAREAANMVDLASDPLKLVEVIRACRRLLLTRDALTAFALASDGAMFLVLVPAVLAAGHPRLSVLATVPLASPARAALAAIVCKALIVAGLIPLALRGARHRPGTPGAARAAPLAYGVAGVAAPLVGVAAVDRLLAAIGLA